MTCECKPVEVAKNVHVVITECAFCVAKKGQETPISEHMLDGQLIAEELRAMAVERLKAKGKL